MPVCRNIAILSTKRHLVDIILGIADIHHEALTSISMSVLESVFRTNAFGPLILTQTLLPNLTAVPNPRIGNITSRLGQSPTTPAAITMPIVAAKPR
jgi:NAD(P)-dependent dehydrogenase (short-subunit alcohol dehydrogenase family)